PGKRGAHVMVYDSGRGRVLMFGGHVGTTGLDDTWSYENGDWVRIEPANSPTPRYLAGGAFDSNRNRMVVFGGNQYSADGKSATEDNMEWDGTNWTAVKTTIAAGRVFGAAMAYDADRSQVIMFGGANIVSALRSNTLLYANGIWVDSTASGLEPQPRSLFAFVTDPVNNAIWMFGGIDDT